MKYILILAGIALANAIPVVPDSFCDFESSTCSVKKYSESTGPMSRVSESGNTFLRLKSKNIDKINRISLKFGEYERNSDNICLSFKYRVSGDMLSENDIGVYDDELNEIDLSRLEQIQTDGWVEFKKTMKTPTNNFDINWTCASPKNTEIIVDFDNFRVSHQSCN